MKTIILADVHAEDPFPQILPKGMIHRYVEALGLTQDEKIIVAEALNDPVHSLNDDDGPYLYHRLIGTQEHLEQLADCYRSDAIQRLWHIYDDDGEPLYDHDDEGYDYDYGALCFLIQFAHYLNDPVYLRPVLDCFDETNPSSHDEFQDYRGILKDAMERLGA
jgi:hypothetical protein